MTARFQERFRKAQAKNKYLVADLMRATGRSDRTIRRWVKDGFPTSYDAYTVALACGCKEAEALALALECFPAEARKSA